MARFVRIEESLPGIWNFFDADIPLPYHISKFFFDLDMGLFQAKEGRGGSGAKRPQYPWQNISVKLYGQPLVSSFANADALKYYLKQNNFPGYFDEISGVPEAPKDGKLYGRKNGEWIEVTGGGGSSTAWYYEEVYPGGTITVPDGLKIMSCYIEQGSHIYPSQRSIVGTTLTITGSDLEVDMKLTIEGFY